MRRRRVVLYICATRDYALWRHVGAAVGCCDIGVGLCAVVLDFASDQHLDCLGVATGGSRVGDGRRYGVLRGGPDDKIYRSLRSGCERSCDFAGVAPIVTSEITSFFSSLNRIALCLSQIDAYRYTNFLYLAFLGCR